MKEDPRHLDKGVYDPGSVTKNEFFGGIHGDDYRTGKLLAVEVLTQIAGLLIRKLLDR